MNKKGQSLIVIGVVILLALVLSGSSMFYTIQPGERAIIFKKFTTGLVKDKIYEPGFHIIAPWNKLIKYDVREQRSEETLDVLDKNGLTLAVDVFVRYNPFLDKIGYIHEQIGPDYVGKIVVPEVRSAVRRIMGKYAAEEIYSTKRAEVEDEIKRESTNVLGKKNIFMQELLIRSIKLPEQLKVAIEMKLKQEQEALAYQFRLEREKSEAERKVIEAEGIAGYNRIISASLTSNILKQKGIDATLELAASQNSKIVVIGSGDEGLPLILGGDR
ncbi:MAG: prohibitin family protein [Bacteroidales bacterium]|nr:prohibitin family protein [Bacteroidales bacterium]